MNKKKLLMFGLPLLAVVLVSAALLAYYGVISGMATVTQSVVLTGSPTFSFNANSFVAGKSFTDCGFSLKNNADVEAPVKFGTTCNNSVGYDDGIRTESKIDWSDFSNDKCDGITTEIYGILDLSTKNTASWVLTGEKATVKYTIVNDTFSAEVVKGAKTGYELIYYKDKENAFTLTDREANPQKAIQIGSVLGKNLPYADDGNSKLGANYCTNGVDIYVHCRGAKIWYVPSTALSGCTTDGCNINWNLWGSFLYETDLIVYSSDASNKITLPAGGGFNFCEKNDFAFNLVPDTYTIRTEVLPA